MSSVFFFEFIDDLTCLKKTLKINKKLIIVSTNYIASNELKKNKIKFIDFDSFFDSKKNYKQLLNRTLRIPDLVEKKFFKLYKNFYKYKWNIFNDFIYPIKTCYDQLFYYTFCLNRIITKYKIKTIYVRYNYKIKFTKDFVMDEKQSVLYSLLKSYKKKIKIKAINKSSTLKESCIDNLILDKVKNKIKYFLFEKLIFKKKITSKNNNIISLSSHETDPLILKFPKLKKEIISLRHFENILTNKNSKKQNNNFIKTLKKDSNIKKFFFINNFDVTSTFILQISNILLSIENIYKKFKFYFSFINKQNTKLIIFSSMAPFEHQNIIFNKISQLKKIPKVTWCHGGYCSINLPGYDINDFKSCHNHFSYGSYLKEITENKNFLPSKIFKKKYQSFNIGSANINLRFNSKNKNSKKKIIFIRGGVNTYNQFYFPITRKDAVKSFFPLTEKILNILGKYQFKYEIIFKNYPKAKDNFFWKSYLAEKNLENIKYVSDEQSLENMLDDNQVIILPWLSTTFFQSLPFKNEIFLYDESAYDNHFKKCKNEINFFKNEDNFLNSLNDFLPKFDNINFKHHKKTLKYFLNNNKINNIKDNFDSAVKKIIRSNYI